MKHNVFLWTIVEALQDHPTLKQKITSKQFVRNIARVKQTSQYTQWLYHDQS